MPENHEGPSAKLSDLIDAFESQSEMNHVYFDRRSGEIVVIQDEVLSAVEEDEAEGSEDLEDWQEEAAEAARARTQRISRELCVLAPLRPCVIHGIAATG